MQDKEKSGSSFFNYWGTRLFNGLKVCSKNSGSKFLAILMFYVSAAFRPFRCHFVKSHQSHSPLCSFFNLQKHTRKKNENQRDIIFRTYLKSFSFIS